MRKAKETWIEEKTCRKTTAKRLPACEKTDKLETREKNYHPGQSREMSHRRTRHSKEVDRILF